MLRIADQAEGIRIVRKDEDARVISFKRNKRGKKTHTIAITSGKGGVGKTQVAANLSVGLARMGFSVLVLDADLGLASMDLALGVRPEHDLRAVVRGEKKIEEILVEGPCGVQLAPACPGRYDMANMGAHERNALVNAMEEVAQNFDVLVIDTGAGIGSNSVEFAAAADDVLLVTTPDPTALRDGYAMAKVLHRRSGVDRVWLIANQVETEAQGAEMHEQMNSIVRRFLELELDYLGAIPRDEKVRGAVAEGNPFIVSEPSSLAARAVDSIISRLNIQPSLRPVC